MAEKKGGKSASPDDVMSAAEMKPILAVAKRGAAASCAIGLTKDKDGVILLDKRKKPKQVLAALKKDAADAGLELEMTSLRFGRAQVDTEQDASLVTFVVNKEASGAMRPKLLERLKKAGFSKVEIVIDAALEAEPEDDREAAPPEAVSAAPASPQSPPPAATAAAAPPAAPPGQDTAPLTKALTDLVKQMIPLATADPALGGTLKALAVQAQTSLKQGDITGTANAIEALRRALAAATAPPPSAAPAAAAAPPVNMANFTKARMAWTAARKRVESELGKLHAEMKSVYEGHGFSTDLDKFFHAKVEPMLDSLDESLAHKLDEVTSNDDPVAHAKLVREAKQIMQRYQSYLSSEPLIAKLDDNPFVPLSIEKTLSATLSTLEKVIR